MTNYDYEKASVEAALGQRKLAAVDAKITETEQALVYLLHQRREIVNQYDLNKKPACEHDFEQVSIAGPGCGAAAIVHKKQEHDSGCEYVLCGGKCYCFR